MSRLSAVLGVLLLLVGTLVWLAPRHGRGGVNALDVLRAKDGHHADAPRPAAPASPRPARRASRGEQREPLSRLDILDKVGTGRYVVTAYTASGYPTASGLWPRPGMCASNLFRFGTRLLIEGVGVVVVEDRSDSHTQIDLYMATRAEALTFGRQTLRVEVLP